MNLWRSYHKYTAQILYASIIKSIAAYHLSTDKILQQYIIYP